MKILLFGRSGQVAREIQRLAGPELEIQALGRDAADLTDPQACARQIAESRCEAVINAAAYTAVDRAEEEEALATRINGEAPGAMAQACAGRDLPFLHISTDYVFDGESARAWREDDPTAPLNAYGRSKLAGERAVAAAGGQHVILRTAWVYAAEGSNFPRTMLRVGAQRDRLSVVGDQRGAPTPAADIAASLLRIACAYRDGQGESGIFHYCGKPATTWYGFAKTIFEQAPWIETPELVAIRSSAWPTPAKRPGNSVLDCSKIARAYGITQPDWRDGLPALLTAIKEETA
ncbi:MAG: dTDP-4-dehydrorhamnose reductase [Rhodospirillales bacterium]